MGWREGVAKALNLPVGAVTQTEQQIAAQVPTSGTTATPLERRPEDYVVPFAPGRPLIPSLINVPREDGRSAPRRSEFPVAWNLQITEQRVVPFRLLRDVADGSDIVRKCIEVVKSAVIGMQWDIVMSPDATSRIMTEPTTTGHTAASREAHDRLLPDVLRCRDFWSMPDRINGLSFPEWVGMALEEMLVIDALSIYPNKTLDQENLHSLEILDGTTIKPLLDDRGGRPVPPHPAFQQILWGFPRGEFVYTADADGEFTADDLIYAPRTRRPFSPYGLSAVERALPMIDLYMKRLQWLRTEFTDGVTPDVFMETDASYGGNPELLRAYERIFNDDLAGKTEQRRRARMLPEGMHPIFPPGLDVKYSPDFDEYLVKQICGHFGVMPTQIGFSPKGGLGGKGIQQGEAASQEVLNIKPMVMWLTDLCNQLSYKFLNMPRDLTFKFTYENEIADDRAAKRREEMLTSGQITINEARAELGYPLFTFPEADMPFVSVNLIPAGNVQEILAGDGVQVEHPEDIGHEHPEEKPEQPERQEMHSVETPVNRPKSVEANPISIELNAFAKWTKGSRKRPFMFEFLDTDKSKALNALAQHDPNAARELAFVFKGKMKTENGKQYPAAAFAYVPDADKPSTWKLRLWEDDKPTAAQVGRAVAALGEGFRGNKVEIPAKDLSEVKAKVRAAWQEVHDKDEELPDLLKGASVSVGSFVSWDSSGGTARGKVERVVNDGKLNVPDSSFAITGTEDDPAVLIRVYHEGEDGWEPTDTRVGHRASTLTRIEALKAADGFTPPKGVREAAKRALEWIKEGHAGDGFTDTGRKRAADLAAGRSLSAETVNRMRSFFARHGVDSKAEGFNSGEDGFPSPGRVAWDAWGGDAGKSWVDSLNTDKSVKASDAGGRDVTPRHIGGDTPARGSVNGEDASGAFSWNRR